MTMDELLFFSGRVSALPLYEALKGRVLGEFPEARVEVKKTQISFFLKHMFLAVSFTPVRRAGDRPDPFLTVTFALRERDLSPRIDAAVEAYPGRWTHHVMIASPEEADDELMGWIRRSAARASGR